MRCLSWQVTGLLQIQLVVFLFSKIHHHWRIFWYKKALKRYCLINIRGHFAFCIDTTKQTQSDLNFNNGIHVPMRKHFIAPVASFIVSFLRRDKVLINLQIKADWIDSEFNVCTKRFIMKRDNTVDCLHCHYRRFIGNRQGENST